MVNPRKSELVPTTGRAIAAISLAVFLLAGPPTVRDAYAGAYLLSQDEIEGLIDLLDKTSFDAAGLVKGYGRLLLWEQLDPVRYWVTLDDVDEETQEWKEKVLRKMHRMIGRNGAIRLLRTPALSDADIAIISLNRSTLFSNAIFFQYLKNIGIPEDEFPKIQTS